MTDRIRTLTVVLEHDMRDDDVQCVVEAIRMVKCVDDVKLGPAIGLGDHIARNAARRDLRNKIGALLDPEPL